MRNRNISRAALAAILTAALFAPGCQGAAEIPPAADAAQVPAASPSAATTSTGEAAGANVETPADMHAGTESETDTATDGEMPAGEHQKLASRPWAEIAAGEDLHAPWARVLAAYVDDEGLVDYAGLAGDGRAELEAYMAAIGDTDPSTLSEAEQIAFWINAYNATTVYQVVQRYPIDSVRDVGALFGLVGGFFKQDYRVAGVERSLDNIEHDILRPTYNDARIHWTLVCAAFGCPRLIRRPYVAADLDPLMTELSFEFMADERALQIDDDSNTLWVSSYFDWYGGDFEAESGTIVDYILRYAPDDKAAWIRANRDDMRVRFMEYDWTLNEQSRGPRSARPIPR